MSAYLFAPLIKPTVGAFHCITSFYLQLLKANNSCCSFFTLLNCIVTVLIGKIWWYWIQELWKYLQIIKHMHVFIKKHSQKNSNRTAMEKISFLLLYQEIKSYKAKNSTTDIFYWVYKKTNGIWFKNNYWNTIAKSCKINRKKPK